MSLTTHMVTLEDKHYRLEALIEAEVSRPMPDFSVIQTLKKQKLVIKEELARMVESSEARQSGGAA